MVFDTTRPFEDPKHANYDHQGICCDFASIVIAFAERNGSFPSDIRLFFYPTKKMWDEARTDWVKRVDWSLPVL